MLPYKGQLNLEKVMSIFFLDVRHLRVSFWEILSFLRIKYKLSFTNVLWKFQYKNFPREPCLGYSLNSYFVILCHGLYTMLQSPAFHRTNLLEATVGNTRADQPPSPLSPWRAVLSTGLGPVSPTVRGPTPNPGESCAFITIPFKTGLCSENVDSPGARVPWVLILAVPPKNHVAWACQLTSGPWIHRAPISQRLPRHTVTLAVTWCNLWHHVIWDQDLKYKYTPNLYMRDSQQIRNGLRRDLELLIHSFRNIYQMLHMEQPSIYKWR